MFGRALLGVRSCVSNCRRKRKSVNERSSELIAFAKARVWASEGWEVKITDDKGKELANLPAENEA